MRLNQQISPIENWIYRHYRAVHGIRVGLAFVCTFMFIRLSNIPEGSWPLITLVVLLGPMSFWGNVMYRTLHRISGTIFGASSGMVALYLELYSRPLMLIWCAITMFFCGYLALGKRPYMALLIGITLAVVAGAAPGDIHTALWRSGDVILGALFALLFASIYPQRGFIHWRLQMSDALSALGKIYSAYTSINVIERPNLSEKLQLELNRVVKMRAFINSASRETQVNLEHFNQLQTTCRDLISTLKLLIESYWSSRDGRFWMINAQVLRKTRRLTAENLEHLAELLTLGVKPDSDEKITAITHEITEVLEQFEPDIHYKPATDSSIYGYIWLTRQMAVQLKELERLIMAVMVKDKSSK
ncbi:FUSC family protein [Celerinatantimonas sp. YJH-8]|uniref:FUSC family protein n=1 Tax=Celerinatantimonas sp. YJH-8 TaxID=3228714 RepID=UPI0038BEBF8A